MELGKAPFILFANGIKKLVTLTAMRLLSQSAQPLDVTLSKAKHLAFSGCNEDEILRLRLRMTCPIGVHDMEMAQIEVVRQDSETFQVIVKTKTRTVHIVTLKDTYHQKLTGGKVTPETLIEKSFEFLLERESNTSILSQFELPVIARYFPEYEEVILKRF